MKLRNFIIAASVIGLSAVAQAEDIKVDTLRYAGPYAIRRPLMIDSTDVESNSFDSKKLLDSPIRLELVEEDGVLTDGVVSSENNEYALHLLGFSACLFYGRQQGAVAGSVTDGFRRCSRSPFHCQ